MVFCMEAIMKIPSSFKNNLARLFFSPKNPGRNWIITHHAPVMLNGRNWFLLKLAGGWNEMIWSWLFCQNYWYHGEGFGSPHEFISLWGVTPQAQLTSRWRPHCYTAMLHEGCCGESCARWGHGEGYFNLLYMGFMGFVFQYDVHMYSDIMFEL